MERSRRPSRALLDPIAETNRSTRSLRQTEKKKIAMRSPQKSNRARGRGNRKGGSGSNVNRVYESAGPEGKVRGTAQQIIEKYLTLGRDAQTSGDRVASENFHQHAEHYQRLLAAALGQQQDQQQGRDQSQSDDTDSDQDDDRQDDTDGGRERQQAQHDGGRNRDYGGRDRDDGNRNRHDGNRERRDEPQRAEGGDEGRSQTSAATVPGMQTIDAGDGDDDGDLLVTPEEVGPGRSRKRGSGRRRSSGGEDQASDESTAEKSTAD